MGRLRCQRVITGLACGDSHLITDMISSYHKGLAIDQENAPIWWMVFGHDPSRLAPSANQRGWPATRGADGSRGPIGPIRGALPVGNGWPGAAPPGNSWPPIPTPPWGRGSRPSRGPGAAGAAHPSSFLPGVPSPALQQSDQPDRAPQVRVSPAERRRVHGRLHPLTGDGLRPGELPEPVGPVDPPEPGLAHPAERSPAGRAARRPRPRPARAGYCRRGRRVQRAERLPGGRRSGPGFLCLGCCHGRRHPRLLAARAH